MTCDPPRENGNDFQIVKIDNFSRFDSRVRPVSLTKNNF